MKTLILALSVVLFLALPVWGDDKWDQCLEKYTISGTSTTYVDLQKVSKCYAEKVDCENNDCTESEWLWYRIGRPPKPPKEPKCDAEAYWATHPGKGICTLEERSAWLSDCYALLKYFKECTEESNKPRPKDDTKDYVFANPYPPPVRAEEPKCYWEYQRTYFHFGDISGLNQHGKQRWEIIWMDSQPSGGYYIYWKRKVCK